MMKVVEQVVVVNKSMMVDHYSSMNNEYESKMINTLKEIRTYPSSLTGDDDGIQFV